MVTWVSVFWYQFWNCKNFSGGILAHTELEVEQEQRVGWSQVSSLRCMGAERVVE